MPEREDEGSKNNERGKDSLSTDYRVSLFKIVCIKSTMSFCIVSHQVSEKINSHEYMIRNRLAIYSTVSYNTYIFLIL